MRGRRREVDPGVVVWVAAALAALLRFPGLFYPPGPDEAGFTLVARAWDPAPDSLYGPYWVDRPPVLIALVRLSDLIGGPLFLRVVAAAGCFLLVLATAATARQALRFAGLADDRLVRRTGAWTALLTAAFTSNAMIDPVMAKGEVLGIPLVVASFWLVLRGCADDTRAPLLLTALAGVAATAAMGLKQNMAAGVVFGTMLLVGANATGRLGRRELWRRLGAFGLGAAVPVAAVLGWATAAGVHLGEVWYAVYGFRYDALAVVASGATDAPVDRLALLTGVLLATGMAFVVAGVVVHRRRIWRLDPVLTVATGAVLLLDLGGLLLGGSFWRQYLFVLVPDMVLCAALLLAVRVHVGRRARVLIVLAAVVSVISSVVWVGLYRAGVGPAEDVASGQAVAAAAEPGDTILAYGGHADTVLASGLDSPYRYLWSLPMRTLDPDLAGLERVLAGPRAPTWVLMMAPGYSWDHLADAIRPVLEARYDVHGRVCNGRYVWLRKGEDRPPLRPDCSAD